MFFCICYKFMYDFLAGIYMKFEAAGPFIEKIENSMQKDKRRDDRNQLLWSIAYVWPVNVGRWAGNYAISSDLSTKLNGRLRIM